MAATRALDWEETKALASVALLWPFAAACKLFWFSWVKASLTNPLYVVHLELAIVFISLVPRPLLKLSIFFYSMLTNSGAYLERLLKACMYLVRVLVP